VLLGWPQETSRSLIGASGEIENLELPRKSTGHSCLLGRSLAMKIIQLQQADGTPVLVNVDTVTFIQPAGDGANVILLGGTTLHVSDSFEAVAELFDPERQAAEPC
jgi:hypothetical protein